jgi:hypothetical protein
MSSLSKLTDAGARLGKMVISSLGNGDKRCALRCVFGGRSYLVTGEGANAEKAIEQAGMAMLDKLGLK